MGSTKGCGVGSSPGELMCSSFSSLSVAARSNSTTLESTGQHLHLNLRRHRPVTRPYEGIAPPVLFVQHAGNSLSDIDPSQACHALGTPPRQSIRSPLSLAQTSYLHRVPSGNRSVQTTENGIGPSTSRRNPQWPRPDAHATRPLLLAHSLRVVKHLLAG